MVPSIMDCNDGRSIQIISFKFIQYFPLLLIKTNERSNYLVQWIVDLEDLFIIIFNIIYILESQMNYNRNSMKNTIQLCQFEWIVIVVDSSIQTCQHNH